MAQNELTPELEQKRQTSRRMAFKDYSWEGVHVERYKPDGGGFAGITRQVITGYSEDTAYHLRYFEISPGGHSSLEKHVHTHVVIGARGMGKVVVGDEAWELNLMDVIYIAPDVPHQLVNIGEEAFGFLCLVNADRDRPRPVDSAELDRIMQNPTTKDLVRTEEVKLAKVTPEGTDPKLRGGSC